MDNKSYDQLLIMKPTIYSNKQYYYEKIKNLTEELTSMIASMMYQIKISKYSPDRKDSPKAQDPTTVVLVNNKPPPL